MYVFSTYAGLTYRLTDNVLHSYVLKFMTLHHRFLTDKRTFAHFAPPIWATALKFVTLVKSLKDNQTDGHTSHILKFLCGLHLILIIIIIVVVIVAVAGDAIIEWKTNVLPVCVRVVNSQFD